MTGGTPLKIAFFDVENSPNLGYYYDPYPKHGSNIVATVKPWFMLSFAYKRPKDSRITYHALPDYPGYKKNKTSDEKLVHDLWHLFDSNDVLMGHNIKSFDTRKANSRFIYWGLKPPSPYIMLDSLKEWRRAAYQDSNRLGDLSKFVGSSGKLPTHGWDTWDGAINGDPKSWEILKKYNKHDVHEAEVIWNVISPWVKNHPRIFDQGCPACGSFEIHRRGRVRQSQKFQFNCRPCGHWFTAKLTDPAIERVGLDPVCDEDDLPTT